jgi:hypothetical protein
MVAGMASEPFRNLCAESHDILQKMVSGPRIIVLKERFHVSKVMLYGIEL